MKMNEYKCAACGNVYEKGWAVEKALAEKDDLFDHHPIEDCAVVCDGCFKKMGFA